MAVYEYAISFVIAADASYSERYQSLMDQIRATPNGGLWDETTSFVLVSSSETIDEIADRLYFNSSILTSKDILVVIDHASNVAIARGPIQYPATFKSHFKQAVIK